MPITDCGIIILAAGSSSRLGTPKQLLKYKNKSLLQHAIDEARASGVGNIIVVTGANNNAIVSQIDATFVQIINNENWQEGMSSSMQAGLSALLEKNTNLSSVIIMLCDQPYISSQLINEIIEAKQKSGKGIVACYYNNIAGVPSLFDAKYFMQLSSLQGFEGAKKIILMNGDDVATIPFPHGAIDIDTMQDYQNFTNAI